MSPNKKRSTQHAPEGKVVCLSLDESSHSQKAIQWLLENIHFSAKDKLYIIHIMVPPESPVFSLADPIFSSNLQQILEKLKENAKTAAQNIVNSAHDQLSKHCENIEIILKQGYASSPFFARLQI
eukprot:Sdes_comp11549_c0_seq1m2772